MIPLSFGEEMMLATGQDARVSEMAGRFLDILMWASVPMLLASVLRNFVSALGRPIFATMITVVAIGVSALANYAFVFGNLGMFALEYSNNSWVPDPDDPNAAGSEGKSENKWLLGAQVGATWKPNPSNTFTGALGYYRFENFAGRRSIELVPWERRSSLPE